jgi:hypothetical protein
MIQITKPMDLQKYVDEANAVLPSFGYLSVQLSVIKEYPSDAISVDENRHPHINFLSLMKPLWK